MALFWPSTTDCTGSLPGSGGGSAWRPPTRCSSCGTSRPVGRVVVGPHERLATTTVHVEPAELRVEVERVQAKLRYRSPAVWASVRHEGDGLVLELDQPAYGIAPGQAAVLYDGDAVVGAGVISR